MGISSLAKTDATPHTSAPASPRPGGQAKLFLVLFLGLGLALFVMVGVVVAAVGLLVLVSRPRPMVPVAAPSEPSLPAGWKLVSYPTGRYSIALPRNIEFSGRDPGSIVRAFTPDGCIGSVSYFDTPGRNKVDREIVMKSTADGHVASAEGSEKQRQKVWALGVSGLEVCYEGSYEGRPYRCRLRVFESDNRIYTLCWLTPDSAADGSQSDAFFDSFKICHGSALTGAEQVYPNAKRRPGSPDFSGR